jgi:hypothetical protein
MNVRPVHLRSHDFLTGSMVRDYRLAVLTAEDVGDATGEMRQHH